MKFIVPFIVISGSLAWIAWSVWQIFPWGKWLFTLLYLLAFLTFFLHFRLEARLPLFLSAATYEIGCSCLIFSLYLLIFFLLLRIASWVHIVPSTLLKNSWKGSAVVFGSIAILLVYGNFHYQHKYRETIEIKTEKPMERPLKIVLASDLHVGYHNRKAELSRWVGMINAEQPDLVLFGGDIVDRSLRPLREGNFAEVFRQLQAPVYACMGNHEYLAGEDGAVSFYEEAGIRLLRDESVSVGGIRVIGRDDRSRPERAALEQLAPRDTVFTLVLDHQPTRLVEAEQAGVDFQFSGHTHYGQVWPANWVTKAIYETPYGAYRKGDTRYYITSGLGIWGGKFRIGTRSEYLVLTIR